eukprot:g1155.t1
MAAIDFQKRHAEKEIAKKNKRLAKMLVQRRHSLLDLEKKDRESFPCHLRKLYEGKNFRLIHELAADALEGFPELQERRADVLSIVDKMREGFISRGEIRPCGFWAPRRQEEIDEQVCAARIAAQRAPSGPPAEHWCSEEDIENMWAQTQKHLAAGRWSTVGYTDDPGLQPGGSHPVTFPVHQSGKVRMCVDFRKKSEQVISREKMRLLGVRATVEALCRLMSDKANQASLFQFKDDIKAQVAEEKLDRIQLQSLAKEQRKAMVARDVANMQQSWDVAQQPAVEAKRDGAEFAFVPWSAKRDLSGLWVPVPKSVRPGATRVWTLVESTCALFGAIVSVYDCVHASELIMLVLGAKLHLCASLYIDDIHLMSRPATSESDQHLLDLFLQLSGFDQSMEKREAQSILQRCLTVLGMAYELSIDYKALKLRIPKEKVEKLHKQGAELLAAIKARDINYRKLLSFRGLFRHVAQINAQLNGVVRGLDKWADEAWFESAVKSRRQRRALKRLVITLLECQKRQTARVLMPGLFERPFAHVYSDASLERLQELKAKLKAGIRSGLNEHDMWVGAVLLLPDGRKKYFKLQITQVPKFVNYLHIGVLELLAVRLAVHKLLDQSTEADLSRSSMSVSQEGAKELSLLAATSAEMQRRINSDAPERYTASAQDTIDEMLKLANGEIIPVADQDEKLRNLIKHGVEDSIPIVTTVPLQPKAGDVHTFMINKGTRPTCNDEFLAKCETAEVYFKGVLMGEVPGKSTPMFLPSEWQIGNVQQAWYLLRDYASRDNHSSYVQRDKLLSAIKVMYVFIRSYHEAVFYEPWDSPFMVANKDGLHEELSFGNNLDRSVRRATDGTVFVIDTTGCCIRMPKFASGGMPEGAASSSGTKRQKQ